MFSKPLFCLSLPMATPLETFDALEVRANCVGRGQSVSINKADANLLRQLTVADLMRRGLTRKSADYICGILAADSDPFRPLSELLGIQLHVTDNADGLTQDRSPDSKKS